MIGHGNINRGPDPLATISAARIGPQRKTRSA